ncbi:MAG: PKD domain-containing protein [Bacteroidota bacterium]
MKQTLRFFILVSVFMFAVIHLAAQQQTRSSVNPGVPGTSGYPAQQQARGPGNPTPQNGNGTLGQIYNFSKCGLNFTQASQRLGQRFSPVGVPQPAAFAISGIPACAVIEQAYLWTEGSGDGSAQTATIVNPAAATQNFPMALVGSGPDKCWGYAGSHTYRANVTPVISGNGNYTISGLFTSPPTSGNDMDGATLMIIYSDPTAAFTGSMVIHDGAVVINGGTTTQTLTGMSVCQNVAAANATAFCMVGDIQMAGQTCTMNGTNAPFAWNWWNYVSVNTALTTGQTTSAYTMTSGGDCFNLCVIGMYFRTTCTPCTSSSLTLTPSSTPATCSNCNGTASVSVAPAGAYTYSWAPSGGNAATATGLCAGTYTVTVSNACNSATMAVTVASAGGGLTVNNAGQTNVNCFGNCNGTASVTVTGGTGPYTYVWTPSGGNAAGATGLCAGTYTCSVTDANGCTGTRTFTITQPPALANTFSQVNVLCNGGNNGSATVTASGGTPGYTFSWTPAVANTTSGSSNTATGLAAGTYVCTITDLNGCTSTRTVIITQPPALTNTFTQVNILCNGNSTGSATVTASGGTPGYTFSWAPAVANTTSGSSNTATGLAAGTYVCTITDLNGCTSTRTVIITQPPALTNTFTQVNILCNGNATGSATVTASGGSPGYTFSWAPAVANTTSGSSNTATGLAAGTYVCTITDLNGCTSTRTVIITQPPALANTFSQVNVLCNGGNYGSATVTASGGTPGYTFSWAPAVANTTSGSSNTATGLAAGTYVCTITDLNGCTSSQTVIITQPPALTVSVSTIPSTCGNPNGSMTATVSGGTGSPAYLWTPSNATTATVNNVVASSYTVLITDANNCTTTAIATVNNLGSPTVNITSFTNVSCFNGNNASATALGSGGTGPLSYIWTNGDTTATSVNLNAGTFTVTVTDQNNCTDTATVTITQPTQVTAAQTVTNVSCFGGNNGTATMTGNGGTGAYTFAWTPSVTSTSSGNSNTGTGLIAGTYLCTVTDSNGCSATQTMVITEPPVLAATLASTNATCFNGCNGTLTATATGGTQGYTYNWSSGCNTANCSNVCAGTHILTVTDTLGCMFIDSVVVTEPAAMSVQMQSLAAFCNQPNGYVNAIGSGGTGNLNYVWNPGNLAQQSSNVIPPGNYTVTVTDQNNCSIIDSVSVANIPGVTLAANPTTSVSCYNGTNGAASVTATGGTGSYTYAWTPNVSTSAAASGLAAGNYVVIVADSAGCTSTVTLTVTQPVQLTTTAAANPGAVCQGQSVTLSGSPFGGTPGYTGVWTPGNLTGLQQTIIPTATTTYTLTVTDLNGCTATAQTTVTVNQQPAPQFTATPTQGCAPLCVNFTDQTGTGSWIWNWNFGDGNTGSGSATPTNCYNLPGSYDVQLIVTDATTGCTDTVLYTNFVNVFANPVAAFGSSPDNATMVNPTIFFTDSSTAAASWNWSFGNLLNSSSAIQNQSFTYPGAGCYEVTLTVTSIDGCTSITSDSVCIGLEATLFVPNAFTPDGDGDNDIFLPVGIGIETAEFEFYIFDRWGNLIFTSDNPAFGWDGRANGGSDIAQIDTYVWRIIYRDVTGSKQDKHGIVTLIK